LSITTKLTRSEGGAQEVLHIRLEDLFGGRSFYGHRRPYPFGMKTRKERGVLTAVARNLEERSLVYGGVGVQRSKGGVGAHLIHKHQALGIDTTDLHAP
jgi:hypothetical protein